MNKVAIYTRHKLVSYSCQLAAGLRHDFETIVFSEDDLGHPNIVNAEAFFDYEAGDQFFDKAEISDVILRCRVLRSLDQPLALSLIKRACKSIMGFLDSYKPNAIVSPRIDNYFLDLLERICKIKGIKFIGLWRSAFVGGMFFLTCRGEFHRLRTPLEHEVKALTSSMQSPGFKGTSIWVSRAGLKNAASRFIYLYLRAITLEGIRCCSKNKFRYRELATRFFVEEYAVKFSDIFYSYSGWQDRISSLLLSGKPKVFLALQVNPEATIDYYCEPIEMIDVKNVSPQIVCEFLQRGYDVIIKDHPNMIGNRKAEFLKSLDMSANQTVLVPPHVDSNYLIDISDLVFTWSGTIAVQALMRGKKAITVCSPYYIDVPGLFKINSLKDVKRVLSILSHCKAEKPDQTHLSKLSSHILSSHLEGEIFLHDRKMRGEVNIPFRAISNLIKGVTSDEQPLKG